MTSILTQNVAAGAAKIAGAQPGNATADNMNSVATSTPSLVNSGTQAAASRESNKITLSDEQTIQIPTRAEQNKKGSEDKENEEGDEAKNKASKRTANYFLRGSGGKIDLEI